MTPATFDDTTVDITAGDYLFRVKGSVPKFAGWLATYGQQPGDGDSSELLGGANAVSSNGGGAPPARSDKDEWGPAGREEDDAAVELDDVPVAQKQAAAVDRAMGELRKIASPAASYVSESNFFEPSWQQSFWGSNYPRLQSVKAKYDRDGLFFVHHGIGSEEWSADGFTRLAGR